MRAKDANIITPLVVKQIPMISRTKRALMHTHEGSPLLLFPERFRGLVLVHAAAHTAHTTAWRHSRHILLVFRLFSDHGLSR